MPDLLLEILTEEIPARMQTRAAEDLLRLAREKFLASGLDATKAESFVTPRRLVLVVEDLPATQADTEEERRGPRVGSPQNAIDGFLKSAGVTLTQCERRDTGKGVFYFAVIRRAGKPTAAILPDLLRAMLLDLPWPKSMRFPAASFRWVRPIASVLCLFDGKVVPLTLAVYRPAICRKVTVSSRLACSRSAASPITASGCATAMSCWMPRTAAKPSRWRFMSERPSRG